MKRIIESLEELHEISEAYSLTNETIEKTLVEAKSAKVCIPIIGKFSSGKSALLNTVLGYSIKLLKEDITPETAVPAEITYSFDCDSVYIEKNDGSCESITIDAYKQLDADANIVKKTRLNLKNSFLGKIPDVMLVDMPGFESGYDVHNKAIDNYLPQSLAYIIAFPADDMIVRSSVGDILKELCLHDMPLCIVITKYDKRNDDYDDTLTALKESLKRYIGDREVTYCTTSSFSGDAEELKDFLEGIQERSQEILAKEYRTAVLAEADRIENSLRTRLKKSEMSESELEEAKDKLNKQLDALNNRFSQEKEDFDLQLSECIEEIKGDVQIALETEESTFVTMAMNSQSINERINTVVRNAVTVSIKRRFIPMVEKYLKRVSNCISGETIDDVHIPFNFNVEKVSNGMLSTAVAGVSAAILVGPIFGAIVTGIVALINKFRGDKKREEIKSQIREKLNSEVYPQVLREVGSSIEAVITKQIKLINTSIEEEITIQRSTLNKELEDTTQKWNEEKATKEKLQTDIKKDLEKIRLIREAV